MKKKNPVIKQKQRDKTPDLSTINQKLNIKDKKVVSSITPNTSTANIIKKKIKKKNSINIDVESKTSNNKTMLELKKENKKEHNKKNSNNIDQSRPKSAFKRSIKHKNKKKEKEKGKEEENIINKNKENVNDESNNKNDEIFNKTGDSFYKPKLNKIKKNNIIDQRRKSFDIALDKKNQIRENSIKKRQFETENEKSTINKNKNERNSLKFGENKNKKKIMNKTPDTGRIKNNKNIKNKIKHGDNIDNKNTIKTEKKLNINIKEKKEPLISTNKAKIEEINNKKETIKINYRYIRNKKYNSNYVECLFLALNSGFFNPNKKLNIIINSKELYKFINNKKIIKELVDYYNKIGNDNIINNSNNNDYDIKKIIEPFNPNDTIINSLNFIDKNEEQKLKTEIQHPYINELFKALLILLNEYNNKKENKNIFEFLFDDILKKYKVKNIKKLMVNYFVGDRIIINDEQFELIQKMLKSKPDLFSPSTLLRYNRAVSYFSFFIKELFNYLSLKTEDGKYYYKIRASLPKNIYQDKINNLKILL